MTVEKSRIPTLNATVRGLFNVQKELGSMRQFNIIPFAGDFWTDVEESDEVERAIHSFQYGRGGDAVGPLRERILKRLERDANEKALYPSVSVIITDGEVWTYPKSLFLESLILTRELTTVLFLVFFFQISVPKLGESIAEMKQTLEYNGYSGPASLFLICRVGSSENAARSLRSLNDIPAIRDMVFLSEDQLDTKLMSMQNDVDLYAGWVSAFCHALKGVSTNFRFVLGRRWVAQSYGTPGFHILNTMISKVEQGVVGCGLVMNLWISHLEKVPLSFLRKLKAIDWRISHELVSFSYFFFG